MPRVVGTETEFAIQFLPEARGEPAPTQEAVFRAILAALKGRFSSCKALYYKGGDFFANGSLVHFEIGTLERPTSGLLEWATPECLSARELLAYAKAQERALAGAIPEAERALGERGFRGRIVALKNNRDRFGNEYGTHESYDVLERPLSLGGKLGRSVLHPIALAAILVAAIAAALPVLALLLVLLLLLVPCELLALLRLKALANALRSVLAKGATFLVEVGPARGSGVLPRVLLWLLRGAALVYATTARTFMFRGHLPQLLPFVATRAIWSGSGELLASGRFELSSRARAMKRSFGAFILGPMRPIVDAKEYFYRRPLSYGAPRKRLQILAGDASRSQYAEGLKIAVTCAVLDALEAGALDETARSFRLLGGTLRALRDVSSDPSLARKVARDTKTGAELTALEIQRRYLEATWEHARKQGAALDPATKDALVRWSFVLDQLAQDPMALDRELDWVVKKRLLDRTLQDALPGIGLEEAWKRLQAFGPWNAAIEEHAPALDLDGVLDEDAVRKVLEESLPARARTKLPATAPAGLSFADFPALRQAWLRLKVVDLRYHELSVEGGYFDWLERDGLVVRDLEEAEIERAMEEPPQRTRARIRGDYVKKASAYRACQVGWDRIVVEPRGEAARTISLEDPYEYE